MIKAVLLPILLLATLLQGSDSQKLGFGKCPKIEVKRQFNLNQYLGKWYQYGSWGTALQGKGKCIRSEYKYDRETGLINLVKTQTPLSRKTKDVLRGRITLFDPTISDGRIIMTVNMPVFGLVSFPFWIIATDYVTWSIAYSCVDFKLFHIKASWITTRLANPPVSLEEEMNIALKKIGMTTDNYQKTDHVGCEYRDEEQTPYLPG